MPCLLNRVVKIHYSSISHGQIFKPKRTVTMTSKIDNFNFFLFGSEEFQQKVGNSILENELRIVRSKEDSNSGQLDIDEVRYGTVWLETETKVPTFFAYEQEGLKNNFPWEYRNQTVDFSFVYTGNEDYSLQAFEQFVEFMRRFESYLREYLLSKGIKTQGDILPIGFYGLLEYEFFRQILTTMKEIQVSFAEPKVMVGKGNVFTMMALVKGKDNDNLEISDVVQWE